MCSPSTFEGSSFEAIGGFGEVSSGPDTVGVAEGFEFAALRPDCPNAVAISKTETSSNTALRISTHRFRVIDLSALQLSAIIDVNRFPFGEDIEYLSASL